ncbi:unnamed protein product [Protopolystoma xenopodis]|uniref:Uncharacterized protein n=1 Tax=Protopolystoma xenopodis TaxID=117903 RepID=A0A448XBM2_9PLAT|nr:unnamed protein product [Protopolystoma xenopodis]
MPCLFAVTNTWLECDLATEAMVLNSERCLRRLSSEKELRANLERMVEQLARQHQALEKQLNEAQRCSRVNERGVDVRNHHHNYLFNHKQKQIVENNSALLRSGGPERGDMGEFSTGFVATGANRSKNDQSDMEPHLFTPKEHSNCNTLKPLSSPIHHSDIPSSASECQFDFYSRIDELNSAALSGISKNLPGTQSMAVSYANRTIESPAPNTGTNKVVDLDQQDGGNEEGDEDDLFYDAQSTCSTLVRQNTLSFPIQTEPVALGSSFGHPMKSNLYSSSGVQVIEILLVN